MLDFLKDLHDAPKDLIDFLRMFVDFLKELNDFLQDCVGSLTWEQASDLYMPSGNQ